MYAIEYLQPSVPDHRYLARQVIFREGEVDNQLFLVVGGSVSVFVNHQPVRVIYEWGVFGDTTLSPEEKPTASIVAGTDCQLVFLTQLEYKLLNYLFKSIERRLRSAQTTFPPLTFSQQIYYEHSCE